MLNSSKGKLQPLCLGLAIIAVLSACTAEMAKTMVDGFIDGARIGVHEAIDDHFGEPSEEGERSGSVPEFENLF